MSVAITGGRGFLAWHVAARLFSEGATARLLGRAEMTDSATTLAGSDAIVHCAGVNRGSDAEVRDGNIDAARALIAKLQSADSKPLRLVYANSTQSGNGTPYGDGKQAAAELLRAYCAESGISYFEALVPNVFGEGGRPNYNSFVATFCRKIAMGETPTVIEDREVTLIHAQQVALHVVAAALNGNEIPNPMGGWTDTVTGVLSRLQTMDERYRGGVFPDLDDPADVDLFNTLRSHIFAVRGPVIAGKLNTDPRGWLVETVKGDGGGQVFVSSTVPGITRGQHFHLRKVERFFVLQGQADITMRRLFSDELVTYTVDGSQPCAVEIPTLHTHAITNTGDGPLITLFWSNELFDPNAPDTYALAMQGGADR